MTADQFMELNSEALFLEIVVAMDAADDTDHARLAELELLTDAAPWRLCPFDGCVPRTVVGFVG